VLLQELKAAEEHKKLLLQQVDNSQALLRKQTEKSWTLGILLTYADVF